MKTIFTFLGKAVVLILYWTLVALFVWLFYDEYVTEQRWPSICMSVAFFSLGCALHGIFISWLYKPELKRFELKYPIIYGTLYEVLEIISSVFLIIFGIGAFCALILPIIGGYALSIISVICHYWEFGLLITFLFIAGVIRKKNKSPMVKAGLKVTYRVSLLFAIILIIYIFVDVWFNHENISLQIGSVLLMFFSAYLFYLLYNDIKKGLLTFAKFRYVLFLRAFQDDETLSSLYNEISMSIDDIPIMKIGDPHKSENENINEHWLPLSKWKFFLKFYISRARAIITVLSSTNGVTWEIGQNIKYQNKCVICFTSLNDLIEFKEYLLSINDSKFEVLINSIDEVIKSKQYGNAFVLRENKIYIGEVGQLVHSVITKDFTSIKFISTTNIDYITKSSRHIYTIKQPISNFLFSKFHILNIVNSFEFINNLFFRYLIMFTACIIALTLWISVFILAVIMTVYPFIIWFGHNINWLGVNYEDYNIFVKILMSWFSISWGIGLIRFLFGKDT